MIDKLSPQTRVILAVALAFVFYVLYVYLFVPPQNSAQNATNVSAIQAPQSNSANVGSTAGQAPVGGEESVSDIIAKITSDQFEIHIDNLGRIAKFYLNGEDFKNEGGERIQLIDKSFHLLPLEVRFSDTKLNTQAFSTSYTADRAEISITDKPQVLVLTQNLDGVNVTKTLTFTKDKGYQIALNLSEPRDYFISTGFRPNVLADGYAFHGAIVKKEDGSLEKIADGDIKKQQDFANAIFAAASDRYYTTLFTSDKGLNISVVPTAAQDPQVFVKGTDDLKLQGYIGPKSRAAIRGVDPKLDDVIEYGFFTWISKPVFSLLYYLHSLIGNWGWSIVVLTILIRIVLYPLTYRGMVSMNKLKELMPKVKELQEKYKDDKQKLNIHVMDLYKKHGANPMGGCLPILIQIPIFFAIYRVLVNTIELKNAEWILWVKDLAAMDPYFILPIAMGLTMFLQQKITPTSFTDPMQEKVMKFLPLIFTIFFLWFPAGLTLYWFVNNLFSIAQQTYINKLFERRKAAEIAKAHNK